MHRSIHSVIATVPPVTSTALHRAELQLCLVAQQESFPDDRFEIASGRDIPRSSKVNGLSPFNDQAGIMRVGDRLCNAQLEDSSKHSILLSSKHQLAMLLPLKYHKFKEIHSFLSYTGHYEFNRLPFGLNISPNSFLKNTLS